MSDAIARPRIDRTVVLVLLGLLTGLSWTFLALRVAHVALPAAANAVRTLPAPWRHADLALLFALWEAMLAAMLLPTAAPPVLLYARVKRLHRERWVYAGTFMFMLGYVCVWTCCALAATLAGWALHDAGMLDEALAVPNPTVTALGLVAAGVYQWTPAKHVCLDNGRFPLAFILTHWRRGAWGAFRMGVTDARYGIGCCWLLLALAFPVGVLNLPVMLPVIGGLTCLMLVEKLLPGGHLLACATGLGLLAWGTSLLFP